MAITSSAPAKRRLSSARSGAVPIYRPGTGGSHLKLVEAPIYERYWIREVTAMNATDRITVDPDPLGDTPVFKGTRVPVKTLFEYLEDNYSLEEFLSYTI